GDVVADAGIASALQEGLEVGRRRVLAEHGAYRLELGALARRRWPVCEKEHLFACVSREAVADGAGEERGELLVAARDAGDERVPQCRPCPGPVCDGREPCEEIVAPMFTQLASAEVDRPVRGVEEPRVRVELSRIDDDGLLGLGEGDGGTKP